MGEELEEFSGISARASLEAKKTSAGGQAMEKKGALVFSQFR
jgi:hypothetical protein